MTDAATTPRARVTLLIQAPASAIIDGFVQPEMLTRYWLSGATAPLQVGETVTWRFLVPGAEVATRALAIETQRLEWEWLDGETRESRVEITLEPFEGGTAVTLVNDQYRGSLAEQVDIALNSTEGFTLVLSDLKTLLESGTAAGLVRAKARLIEARR